MKNIIESTRSRRRDGLASGVRRPLTGGIGMALILLMSVGVGESTGQQSAPAPIMVEGPPRLLGPGVISTAASEFGAAFTDRGNTVFYTLTDGGFSRMTIVYSTRVDGEWSRPKVAPFSGFWNDGDISAAPDGRRLLFMSNRPITGSEPRGDFDIWYVDRQSDGSWGAPVHAGAGVNSDSQETYPAVSARGGLYFARDGAILRAQWGEDGYGAARPQELHMSPVGAPAIAPDESFLVFTSAGPGNGNGDLFAARRGNAGWQTPRAFAEPVNSAASETAPAVVMGGRSLCFASHRREWPGWPRAAPVSSYEEALGELSGMILNGTRNIYCVEVPQDFLAQERNLDVTARITVLPPCTASHRYQAADDHRRAGARQRGCAFAR